MTHEERNTVAALLTSILVLAYFGQSLRSDFVTGAFDGTDGLMVWARTVLWIIPFCIVATIVMTIGVNIAHAILTNTPNPGFITDERDVMIARRGHIVTMSVASFGFIATLVMLAFGWSALAAFNLLLFMFFLSDFAGNLSKMAAYRFGL